MEKPKRIRSSIVVVYFLCCLLFCIVCNVEITYMSAFLTDFALLPLALTAIILNVTNVFDVVWGFFSGVVLQKLKCRGGKYRPLILVLPILWVIFYLFEFSAIGTAVMTAVIITVGFILCHICWNLLEAATGALVMVIAPNSSEDRARLSVSKARGQCLSSMGFSVVFLAVLKFFGNNTTAYAKSLAVFGVLCIILFIVLYFMTARYKDTDLSLLKLEQEKPPTVGELLKTAFGNRSLLALMGAETFRSAAIFLFLGVMYYYFAYVLEDLAIMSVVLTIKAVFEFIASLIGPAVIKFCGSRKRAYVASEFIAFAGFFLIFLLNPGRVGFVVLLCIGCAFTCVPSCVQISSYSDCAVYSQWRSGKDVSGFTIGLLTIPMKICMLIKTVAITVGLLIIGYTAGMEVTSSMITGFSFLATGLVGIFHLIAALIYAFGYHITDEKLTTWRAEIEARSGDAAMSSPQEN